MTPAEEFPETYRSDEQDWAKGIRMKNQAPAGTCWAFSSTTAAEYSYAKQTYDSLGPVTELSPGHLAYFNISEWMIRCITRQEIRSSSKITGKTGRTSEAM